ncbi:hypothetical protein OUZ56_001203 [Daphnia magna]|uniref:Uncharacterized protein n=1 Tax=Daphnia magna TaxID=35525 RepID=A0ABR0A1Y1_9CRUS|nr:hypothetical protein OUZ56_001203 [Daphnia magna]
MTSIKKQCTLPNAERHGEARQRETKSKTKPNRITEQKFSVTAAQDHDRHKDRTGEGDDYLV